MNKRRCGFIALIALAGCARPGPQPALTSCQPTAYGLTAEDGAAGLAGEFSLQLFATAGDSAGRSAGGRLTLRPALRADAVLVGTSDVALGAVGALLLGPLDAVADSAPGVLVFESPGARPRILLRFGSGTNVQGIAQFDGGYTVLQVHRIDPAGFQGAWRSGTGLSGDLATGHFCAHRARAGRGGA